MQFSKAPIALALLVLGLISAPAGATSLFINFSTEPSLPAQPNNFNAAGAMQTYTKAGVYSISGGVVLGNPNFLAAFPGSAGSAPNLYGTTDIADPSLLATITLTFPVAAGVTGVSGVLFNGQPFAEDYSVQANGANPLNFLAVQDDTSTSASRNFSYSGIGTITSVTVTSPNSAVDGWDFFVDDITLTFASATPEPSTLCLVFGGLALAVFRKKRFW